MPVSGWSGPVSAPPEVDGVSSRACTNPPRSGPSTTSVSAAAETARTVPSTGAVASLGASLSWRSQPVTSTVPDGGAGTSAGSGVPAGDSTKPRSTSTTVPSSRRSGTTTSTPRSAPRFWYRTSSWSADR